MKAKKTLLAVVLIVLLIAIMLPLAVQAAESNQDGLEISLVTDKESYSQDENITATLTVTNTNSYAFTAMSLEGLIPEGYALAAGSRDQLVPAIVSGGATVTLRVTLVPDATATPDVPPTGDDSHIGLRFWMLLGVGIVLIVLIVDYKHWKRTIALVLCLTMMVGYIPAKAAEADEELDIKTVHLSTEVQVDGKPLEVEAVVRYQLPVLYTAQFDLNYEDAPQMDSQLVSHGTCLEPPAAPTREGFDFACWLIEVDGEDVQFDFDEPVTSDLVLRALWVENVGSDIHLTNFHKVSFALPSNAVDTDREETAMPKEQLVATGSLVYSMPEPTCDGYSFAGWYYDESLAKRADTEDVILKDITLYPMMLPNEEIGDHATNNYVADLDVSDLDHSVTVKAPSAEFIQANLAFVDVLADNTELEYTIQDNGDGTYTIRAAGGLEGGKTYQLRALDRDQLPGENGIRPTEDYILFYHNGELQSMDIRYYNIFTTRPEENNMFLNGDIILLSADEIYGLDMEQVSSLYTVTNTDDGQLTIDTNQHEGSFRYTGDKELKIGDVVLVYVGDASVEEEYMTSHTVGNAEETAFLRITYVNGDTYGYCTPDLNQVLYTPDVLPLRADADTDGDAENYSMKVYNAELDYAFFPVESELLDENTTADPGDFLAIYSGTLDDPGQIVYGRIVTVTQEGDFTILTYEPATMEDIQRSMDTYLHQNVPIDITEGEAVLLENQIVQQALDSEFTKRAAAFAVREKLGMAEDPVWGQRYPLSAEQAELLGVDVEAGEIDAGMFLYMLSIDPPDINAQVTTELKRITSINGGIGVRVAFGIYIPVGIEVVNVITQEVDSSLKMDLYVTMEQELAFDLAVSASADVDLFLGFIPTDFTFNLSASFDVGTYTGVGAVIMVDMANSYEKSYLWNELVDDDGSNGAFTSASSLSDQLNAMLEEGNTSFFDMYRDEEGNSTLVEAYTEMLNDEVDYMDILVLPIGPPLGFKGKITPKVPVAEYKIAPELVFAAKLNVTLGASFEALTVKQFSFSIHASARKGVSASAGVVDKQTPYHSVNMLIMGNVGFRAGFRITASIGILSLKLNNVGFMLELGFYLDLYGFGYYHYDWRNGKTNIQKAGAIYLEIGFYMDIDLFGGLFLDLLTFTIHALELEVPIWSTKTEWYTYGIYPYRNENKISDSSWLESSIHVLNPSVVVAKQFNIVDGRTKEVELPDTKYTIQIPAEYQDLLWYQERYPDGRPSHLLMVRADRYSTKEEFHVNYVLKESVGARTRAASKLDSLYDLIGQVEAPMYVTWTCHPTYYDISYDNVGPTYAASGSGHGWPRYGDSEVRLMRIVQGAPIPEMSINHKAPNVPGMDFAGWEIECWYYDETFDGMYIEDLTDLAGMAMPYTDILLKPLYTPRNDTKYVVRHYAPSPDNPDEYEVFYEEEMIGETNDRLDRLDYVLQVNGLTLDIDKTGYSEEYVFYYLDFAIKEYHSYLFIHGDGSTEVALYYKRALQWVTIHGNNKDLPFALENYFSDELTGVTHAHLYAYGETIVDPGYANVKIPGYTFKGWATTPDNPSQIYEEIPSVEDLPYSKNNIDIYAIWEPETVKMRVAYYLHTPDTQGLDQFEDEWVFIGEEWQDVTYGTPLWTRYFEPQTVELPDHAWGCKVEFVNLTPASPEMATRDYIYHIGANPVIIVYYNTEYSLLAFDWYDRNYEPYGESTILPEAEKEGYIFLGWQRYNSEDNTIYPAGYELQLDEYYYYFESVFVAATDTPYTVEHYLEDPNGNFSETPFEVETLYGTSDTYVTPESNTYPGFDPAIIQKVLIEADGSTVVQYYYYRSTYRITLDWQVEGEDFGLRGQYAGSYRYGMATYLMDEYNPVTATREGYTIIGWYLDDPELNPDKTPLDSSYRIPNEYLESMKDLVFKPIWQKLSYEYKVEHYLQQLDGSYVLQQTDSLTGLFGDTVTAKEAIFTGFTFDPSVEGSVISGTVASDGSLVLKVYYTRNSYDVTWYDYDGQTLLATESYLYGQTFTAPAVSATRTGYTFDGWNVGTVTMPASNLSYNAKDHGNWTANTYTVKFNANGGEGTMADQTFTYDKLQALSPNVFTKQGYAFDGWALSADGEVVYADQAQVINLAASGSITLYAKWTVGPEVAYTVEYYGETLDGTGYEVIKTENRTGVTDTEVSASPISIEGFTYDAANSGNLLSGTIAADGSLVLKLYYTRNSYTLTIDFNGESMKQAAENQETWQWEIVGFDVADQVVTLKYGQTLEEALTGLLVPVIVEEGYWGDWDEELQDWIWVPPVYEDQPFETAFPGYTFGGWDGETDTMPAGDLTLTAQWNPIQITVTFYSGWSDGYAPNITGTTFTKTYSYGDTVEYPENDFYWEGYVITGWKFGNGGGGFGQYAEIPYRSFDLVYNYYAHGDHFMEGDTLEVFAYWTSESSLLTIEFNANGGQGRMDTYMADGYSASIPFNKFYRDGYTFVGWNTAPDGSGDAYEDGGWISEFGTVVLYAQWEEITEAEEVALSEQTTTACDSLMLYVTRLAENGFTIPGKPLIPAAE